MKAVVDASLALSWVLPGEDAGLDLRRRAVEEGVNLLVPSLFPYEVANALWAAVRRGRLEEGLAHEALGALWALGWEVWEVEPDAALELALSVGLPVYDSAYLALALHLGLPLWTLDASLAQAARRLGVPVAP